MQSAGVLRPSHVALGSWGQTSSDSLPASILSDLIKPHVFVFLGRLQPVDQIDYRLIVEDFDRLLLLYQYVEGSNDECPTIADAINCFEFKPGCTVKPPATTATIAERRLDINPRHNEIRGLYISTLSLSTTPRMWVLSAPVEGEGKLTWWFAVVPSTGSTK
jgi:hypothetical protein